MNDEFPPLCLKYHLKGSESSTRKTPNRQPTLAKPANDNEEGVKRMN